MPAIAVGWVEHQTELKRPPLCDRLGSFWFSTRFTRKKSNPLNAENCVRVLTVSFVNVDSEQPLRRSRTILSLGFHGTVSTNFGIYIPLLLTITKVVVCTIGSLQSLKNRSSPITIITINTSSDFWHRFFF